jgi:CRISPR-associated protein Cas2
MFLVTYDIQNDKTRDKFCTFLKKYGWRLQYSVFALKNSEQILDLVVAEIENTFIKMLGQVDSVLIFPVSEENEKKTISYGYTENIDKPILS